MHRRQSILITFISLENSIGLFLIQFWTILLSVNWHKSIQYRIDRRRTKQSALQFSIPHLRLARTVKGTYNHCGSHSPDLLLRLIALHVRWLYPDFRHFRIFLNQRRSFAVWETTFKKLYYLLQEDFSRFSVWENVQII